MEATLVKPHPQNKRLAPMPLRLLVVEDHGDLARTLQAFFQLLGHQASFVKNAAGAVESCRGHTFDVLLSDISLPDGTGWELLQRLEADGNRPAVAIAMSGWSAAKDLARSKEVGFRMHLVKPFEPENLEKSLLEAASTLAGTDLTGKPLPS